MKSIDNQIDKLIELFQFGSIAPEKINERIEKLNEQKTQLNLMLKKLDIKRDKKDIETSLSNLTNFDWDVEPTAAKIDIIHDFVDTVTVTGDEIDIVWNLQLKGMAIDKSNPFNDKKRTYYITSKF